VELILKVDNKGRILIPAEIRRLIGIKSFVKATIRDKAIIIEPINDPLEELTELVLDKNGDIEQDIKKFRKVAEKELMKIVGGKYAH